MGGLGPGIGGLEYLLIAAVALIVVGPERLPVMLRTLGQWIGKARRMADEFRSTFDEMARQSELDDLRKEVEALRTGQGMHRLGDEADAAFKDIKVGLEGTDDGSRAIMAPAETLETPTEAVDEWPDAGPEMTPLSKPVEAPTTPKTVAPKAVSSRTKPKPKAKSRSTAVAKTGSVKTGAAKPRARKAASRTASSAGPSNSKLDL